MLSIHALGNLELQTEAGVSARSVLFQPKRVALLAYLAFARPRGFHRRDTLLALLWPDLNQRRARVALNKGLYDLRTALGAEMLPGRGDGEIGLAWDHVSSDVHAFEATLDGGDLEGALNLYRGELLQGFHVSGVPEFEHWLDTERSRLAVRARRALARLIQHAEAEADLLAATRWTRRALTLAPDDEPAMRTLMRVLERTGDRAGALREFEVFERRLTDAYEMNVSAETAALAESIRSRAGQTGFAATDEMHRDGAGRTDAAKEAGISFRTVAENLADMIVLIDGAGKVHYISPAVEPVTGVPSSEMIGRIIWDFIHPDDVAHARARTGSRLRGEGDPAAYTEIRMGHVDGSWRRLQLRGRRYVDEKLNVPMVLVVAREIASH